MNYGKDATEKRLQAVNSEPQIPLPDFSYLYKDLLRAFCLFSVLVISSIGIGIVMGIIDNPGADVDSIVPHRLCHHRI